MEGKCFQCSKITGSTNDLLCLYDGYYCSKRCALDSLIERQEQTNKAIIDLALTIKWLGVKMMNSMTLTNTKTGVWVKAINIMTRDIEGVHEQLLYEVGFFS